jgi:hypothetical protein
VGKFPYLLPRFSETQFELFVLLGVLVLVYGGVVFMIWK